MKFYLFSAIGILSAILTIASRPKSTEDIAYEAYFETFFGHFNAHDWEAMAGMYAESTDIQDPSLGFGTFKRTRQDIIDQYAELSAMIPDVQDSVVNIYPSGNTVTVEFISTGTAPDGTKFALPICAIMTFEDGLIVSDHVYYDNF
ncbi:MAG: nuclear transport factor 2 family protein [Bacteroidota bacterium]